MLFFNNNLAMGEPIIIESLPNTRPTPTKKFIVPEHIAGTKNLFIFINGQLQRGNYVDNSWNTVEFLDDIAQSAHFVSVLFVQGDGEDTANFYKLFLEGDEGQVVFNSPKSVHGIENDYMLTRGHYIETDEEFDWVAATETDFGAIFNTWETFSHGSNGLFPSNAAELSGWNFVNNRIVSAMNSTTYIGWITPDAKTSYNIQGTLKSTNFDNDTIAIVVAFTKHNNKEYTISAVRNNEDFGYRWALVYNFRQPDEWVIANGSSLVRPGTGSWQTAPNGVFVKAEKNSGAIRAWASEMNETSINDESMLEISLTSDDRLLKFTGATQSGYGCWSQQDSTFENIDVVETRAYNMSTQTEHIFTPATGWVQTTHSNIGEVLGYGRFFYNPQTSKLFFTGKQSENLITKPLEWQNF